MTTKWAVTANEELRRILIEAEEWSKMARHGGISSDMLDADRKDSDEYIKVAAISLVSISNPSRQAFPNITAFGNRNWIK